VILNLILLINEVEKIMLTSQISMNIKIPVIWGVRLDYKGGI